MKETPSMLCGLKYDFLSQEEAAEEGENFHPVDRHQYVPRRHETIWASWKYALCASMILIGGFGIGYGFAFRQYAIDIQGTLGRSSLFWSDDLKHMKFEWKRLNGTIYGTNQYKGAPSPEIDAAWNRYTESEWAAGTPFIIPVTLENARRTSNDASVETFVELGDENGGGFMASLEMFHQIHCLNMLRKSTHRAYYEAIDPLFTDKYHLQDHLDHCIDIIRQVLMCNSDTGLVMAHWVKKTAAPSPDFNTFHQCRDPELVLTWAKEHAAPMTKHLTKSKNTVELDDWE